MPRIALIHATALSIDPVLAAFSRLWPEAELANILDDTLSIDRSRDVALSDNLLKRIVGLGHYAAAHPSDGILYTCSAFGAAIEQAARELPLPVLRPNEAMFEAAIAAAGGTGRIAMLYTFEASRAGLEAEFAALAATTKPEAALESFYVPGARAALSAGEAARHNSLIADAARGLSGFDAVILAHFSMARARPAIEAATALPLFTAPDSAVEKLKRRLLG